MVLVNLRLTAYILIRKHFLFCSPLTELPFYNIFDCLFQVRSFELPIFEERFLVRENLLRQLTIFVNRLWHREPKTSK